MKNDAKEEFTYIKIPENSTIKYAGFTLDPSKPLPVVMTEEDKKRGDVALSSIKTGLITAIAHRVSDKIANEYFDYYKDVVLSEKDALKNLIVASQVRLEKKDFKNAEVLLKAILNLSPSVDAFILLSSVYASLASENENKDKEAFEKYDTLTLETLKAAHKAFGDDPSILMELGCFHFREGNYESAEEYFNSFLKNAMPSDKRRANAESLKQKATKAIEEEEKVAEISDDIMMDRRESALTKAKELFDKHQNESRYYILYGWTLRVNEKYTDAKDVLLKALKMGGEEAVLFNELSLSEWEVGSKELAKEYMKMAADLDSSSSIFASNLALMCISLKEQEEAERAIYSLIERDKNDPMIQELVEAFNKISDHEFVYPRSVENDEHNHECRYDGDCNHHHSESGECTHNDDECKCGHHHDNCECEHNHSADKD